MYRISVVSLVLVVVVCVYNLKTFDWQIGLRDDHIAFDDIRINQPIDEICATIIIKVRCI